MFKLENIKHNMGTHTEDFGVTTSDTNTYTYYTQNSHISEVSKEQLSSSETESQQIQKN